MPQGLRQTVPCQKEKYKDRNLFVLSKAGIQDPDIEQAKLLRVLQIIEKMKTSKITIAQMTEAWDISERTAYRYIRLIEAVGMPVDKDFDGKYFIHR